MSVTSFPLGFDTIARGGYCNNGNLQTHFLYIMRDNMFGSIFRVNLVTIAGNTSDLFYVRIVPTGFSPNYSFCSDISYVYFMCIDNATKSNIRLERVPGNMGNSVTNANASTVYCTYITKDVDKSISTGNVVTYTSGITTTTYNGNIYNAHINGSTANYNSVFYRISTTNPNDIQRIPKRGNVNGIIYSIVVINDMIYFNMGTASYNANFYKLSVNANTQLDLVTVINNTAPYDRLSLGMTSYTNPLNNKTHIYPHLGTYVGSYNKVGAFDPDDPSRRSTTGLFDTDAYPCPIYAYTDNGNVKLVGAHYSTPTIRIYELYSIPSSNFTANVSCVNSGNIQFVITDASNSYWNDIVYKYYLYNGVGTNQSSNTLAYSNIGYIPFTGNLTTYVNSIPSGVYVSYITAINLKGNSVSIPNTPNSRYLNSSTTFLTDASYTGVARTNEMLFICASNNSNIIRSNLVAASQTTWATVSGLTTRTVAFYNGNLYCAGYGTTAASRQVTRISTTNASDTSLNWGGWSGVSFTADFTNCFAQASYVYNGNLYIAYSVSIGSTGNCLISRLNLDNTADYTVAWKKLPSGKAVTSMVINDIGNIYLARFNEGIYTFSTTDATQVITPTTALTSTTTRIAGMDILNNYLYFSLYGVSRFGYLNTTNTTVNSTTYGNAGLTTGGGVSTYNGNIYTVGNTYVRMVEPLLTVYSIPLAPIIDTANTIVLGDNRVIISLLDTVNSSINNVYYYYSIGNESGYQNSSVKYTGVSPYLYNFTISGLDPGTYTIYVRATNSLGSSTSVSTTVTLLPIICFKENTKIFTNRGYKAIQRLKPGDMVKTYQHGFVPVFRLGKKDIYHKPSARREKTHLYCCTKEEYPELIEDLVMTGCHSILVDDYVDEEQLEKTIEVNGNTYVTEGKYRLPVCADLRARIYDVPGKYTVYHVALQNQNYYGNYGIYANGLLVESTSKRFLEELAIMDTV
jgi:hypothetical protein